jgi:hypothetical protein
VQVGCLVRLAVVIYGRASPTYAGSHG